jgi:hypothetical protein
MYFRKSRLLNTEKKYHNAMFTRKNPGLREMFGIAEGSPAFLGALAHDRSSSAALSQIDDTEPLTEFFNGTYYPPEFKRVFPPFRIRCKTHRQA